MDVGMHNGLCCNISGNQNLLGGNSACPLLWKKTLSYKAVFYINIFGKRAGNKGQLVLLLIGCAEMRETHGKLSYLCSDTLTDFYFSYKIAIICCKWLILHLLKLSFQIYISLSCFKINSSCVRVNFALIVWINMTLIILV